MSCKLCGASKYKILSTKRISSDTSDFKLVQCLNCGLCFVDPIPPREIQESFFKSNVAVTSPHDIERFNRKIDGLKHPIRRLMLQLFKNYQFYPIKHNLLLKFLFFPYSVFTLKNIISYRGKGKILDVGCNNGLYLAILQTLGWRSYGVEPELSLYNEAKKQGIKVFHSTLEKADFPDKHFDVVRFNQVFEHVDNPIEILKEAGRILNDNGRIYIEVPNQKSFSFYAFREDFYGYPMHLYIFSPHTIRLLCKKIGLRVRKIRIRCSTGLFLNCLRLKCKSSKNVVVRRLFPLTNWRLVELIFVKPFCFILYCLRLGNIFEAEISK